MPRLFKSITLLFVICLLVSILTVEIDEEQKGSLRDRCPTFVDSAIEFAFEGQTLSPALVLHRLEFRRLPAVGAFMGFDTVSSTVYRGPPQERN